MWIASVLVALVVVGFLALVVWLVWRSRRQQDSTLERIAQEVQFALDELQAGGDLRNVVIRCYSEMVQALREQRGILRNVYLTPREFEDTLHGLGFPPEPVHQLTHLFEAVRYGHKPITRREELVAKDSLTAILDACRSNG
jgi:type II secretory pathway pseudopilin PulG